MLETKRNVEGANAVPPRRNSIRLDIFLLIGSIILLLVSLGGMFGLLP